MSDPFVHLHVHSEYSCLDGYGHPQQFVDRAKELGQTALAITDHGNVSAHKRWYDSCHETGIKPLLGVEAYVVDDASSKSQRGQWHITLLAKNLIGYRNLLKIVTLSYENGFYYKPRTDWSILQQFSEGVIATSSCPSGKIGRGVTREGWSDKQVVAEMKKQAGLFKDYYAEVSPWDYDDGKKVATAVYKAAQLEGIPLVLTMDAHYPRSEDAKIQDVMLCIQNQAKFNDPNRMKFSQQDFCLWSGEDMARKWTAIHGARLPGLDEMITNTGKIADMVDFEFPTGSLVSFPYDGDKIALLRRLCEEGFNKKGYAGKQHYKDRMEYEFRLVVDKGFVDYFLIVHDLINWAKQRGILVGAARGSSCGSLLCYLLHITEIDPIPYGLFFERFIDITRSDLPDIDIDFEAERRDEVKQYMAEKYGQDRVASLATFGTFKGKLCLQDIGRVFGIPTQAVEETKRLIIQRSSADSRAGFTIEDTFTNFEQAAEWLKKYPELGLAKHLEGQIRQLGVHAAGMVISNEPIGNFAAVYTTKNKDRVLSMDYHDATSVGLMKIDVLGLTSLTAVKRTLASIKKNHGVEIDLLSLPLDDEAVYKNFCDCKLWGVFQFEGSSCRQVCKQVQPKTFEDLAAVNALSRPGPLHSGSTTSYIERRFGRDDTKSLHPLIDDCVSSSHHLTIYQEQVMFIVRRMGKFSWEETSSIRRAMSKKLGDEFVAKMKQKFIKGAMEQDVSKEAAELVWQNIATHGSWSFNKSHSVAYSMMAYQIMWLKTHHPSEFYAGFISAEADTEKQQRLLREHKSVAGAPLPVSINESEVGCSSSKQGLRLGLDAVVGLGEKAILKLVQNRPYKNYVDLCKRSGLPKSKCEVLLKIGALRDLNFSHTSEQADLFGNDAAVSGRVDYRNPKEEDLRACCPTMLENKACQEYRTWLAGKIKDRCFKVSELDDISQKTDIVMVGCSNPSVNFNAKNKMEEAKSKGKEFLAKAGEEHFTKEHYNFLNFDTSDETDTIISRVGYKIYPKLKSMLWAIRPDDVVAVRGCMLGEMRMVFAYGVVNLTQLRAKIDKGEKLTKEEAEFLNPPPRKKYARNR